MYVCTLACWLPVSACRGPALLNAYARDTRCWQEQNAVAFLMDAHCKHDGLQASISSSLIKIHNNGSYLHTKGTRDLQEAPSADTQKQTGLRGAFFSTPLCSDFSLIVSTTCQGLWCFARSLFWCGALNVNLTYWFTGVFPWVPSA